MGGLMGELSSALPGIDEAMSFAQVMKLIKTMEYEVIVFDTAPTGHTLRFLSFPTVLEKGLAKLSEMGGRFGPMIAQASSMMGMDMTPDTMMSKVREMAVVVKQVNDQFQDSNLTTFVCVAIAEFLSLYETERMIQELLSFNIDTHNIVVNQLLFPREDCRCEKCLARWKIQKKYLEQMEELYGEDFHLVKLELMPHEVRGLAALTKFSKDLLTPK